MSAAADLSAPNLVRRGPVSPYARRLARERGLSISAFAGTGPGGRIVAADVLAFTPAAAREESAARNVPPVVEMIAARIDLAPLNELAATFSAAGRVMERQDVLLRAAALALAAHPDAPQGCISLEGTEGELIFEEAAKLSVPAIRAIREGGVIGPATGRAALSLRVHLRSGIRSVFMPLKAGVAMRLAVSFGDATAECLLAFDTATVPADLAEAILAELRDGLEAPLALFV